MIGSGWVARRAIVLGGAVTGLALILVAGIMNAAAPAGEPRVIALRELNGSGVRGTATFTDRSNGRVLVEIVVEPAGYPDMPAHIHPGSCDQLVPQPEYPLENVRAGRSTTEIPATIAELLADEVAVNLHASVEDLKTYTACADIN